MIGGGRKSMGFMMGYNLIYLGVNYLWISYETMILPTQVSLLVPLARASFILGITASIGNAAGILGNLSSGFMVDRIIKRSGRRYILIGAGIAGVLISLVFETQTLSSLILIIGGYVAIQASSNIAMGAVQPIVAEMHNEADRGTSAGFNGLFSLMGSAMGFGITSIFLSSGFYDHAIFSLMIGIIITGSGSALVIERNDSRSRIAAGFSPAHENIGRPRDMRVFSLFSLGSFFVFSGITGLTYFELFFFRIVLKSTNPDLLVGIAGITVLVISALSSVVVAHFSNRIGRWKILQIAAITASVPTLIIPLFHNFYIFLALGSIIGAAYGSYYSVSFAMAGELTLQRNSGRSIAFFYLSISVASAISPFIYGIIIFIFRNTANSGYTELFLCSGILYLIGAAFLNYTGRRYVPGSAMESS